MYGGPISRGAEKYLLPKSINVENSPTFKPKNFDNKMRSKIVSVKFGTSNWEQQEQ